MVVGVVETHGRGETAALLRGLCRCCRRRRSRTAAARWPSSTSTPRWRASPDLHPGRRTGAHQRAGLAPPQALAGRGGTAGRRHRRLHHAQRAAPREPERRGRRHHRHRACARRCPTPFFDARRRGGAGRLPPDELLERLAAGKVYLPEQAERAAKNFFRKGNLIALRELALRRTAERVEDDVQAYRVDRVDRARSGRPKAPCCAASARSEGAEHVVRSAAQLAQAARQ